MTSGESRRQGCRHVRRNRASAPLTCSSMRGRTAECRSCPDDAVIRVPGHGTPVCISAPAAVATILVVSTSERHPYRVAEHMSLCCCLRHVRWVASERECSGTVGTEQANTGYFAVVGNSRHNNLCKHMSASVCLRKSRQDELISSNVRPAVSHAASHRSIAQPRPLGFTDPQLIDIVNGSSETID